MPPFCFSAISLLQATVHSVKMKVLLVFLAVFGLSYAAPSKRDLASDLQQIAALIPIDAIREVIRKYIEVDPEVQQVVAYLQGPEWRALVDSVGEKEAWKRFIVFMLDNEVDVQAIIDNIREIIQGIQIPPNPNISRSIRELADEIRALVDLDLIVLTANELLRTSESFQAFYEVISGPASRELVEEVRADPEVQRVAQVLRDMAIDIDAVVAFVYTFLGWEEV